MSLHWICLLLHFLEIYESLGYVSTFPFSGHSTWPNDEPRLIMMIAWQQGCMGCVQLWVVHCFPSSSNRRSTRRSFAYSGKHDSTNLIPGWRSSKVFLIFWSRISHSTVDFNLGQQQQLFRVQLLKVCFSLQSRRSPRFSLDCNSARATAEHSWR